MRRTHYLKRMAGQKHWAALKARLDAAGGLDYICDEIADGASLKKIGNAFGSGRAYIMRYITEHGDVGMEQYRQAQKEKAHYLAEESLEILDEADGEDENHAKITAAKNRSQGRQWLASMLNREDFGQSKAGTVHLSIAQLHLDVLREGGGPDAQRITDAEFKVLPAGEPNVDDLL